MIPTTITIPALALSTAESPTSITRLVGSQELALLEIQGSITRVDQEDPKFGRLEQTIDGRVFLTIGYQRLEGKVVTLKAPFAILQRPPQKEEYDALQGAVELKCIDICTKKITFNMRPEPLNQIEQ